MPRLLLAMLLLVAAETTALACSCMSPPKDPSFRRRLAQEDSQGALALIEADIVSEYDEDHDRDQRLRVKRTLLGQVPAIFDVEQSDPSDILRCEMTYSIGSRRLLVLYRPRHRSRAAVPRFRISSACQAYLLEDAPYRRAFIREFRRSR